VYQATKVRQAPMDQLATLDLRELAAMLQTQVLQVQMDLLEPRVRKDSLVMPPQQVRPANKAQQATWAPQARAQAA
jgi:hypothetical protein